MLGLRRPLAILARLPPLLAPSALLPERRQRVHFARRYSTFVRLLQHGLRIVRVARGVVVIVVGTTVVGAVVVRGRTGAGGRAVVAFGLEVREILVASEDTVECGWSARCRSYGIVELGRTRR